MPYTATTPLLAQTTEALSFPVPRRAAITVGRASTPFAASNNAVRVRKIILCYCSSLSLRCLSKRDLLVLAVMGDRLARARPRTVRRDHWQLYMGLAPGSRTRDTVLNESSRSDQSHSSDWPGRHRHSPGVGLGTHMDSRSSVVLP
jgi:hypothetical protein